MRATDVVGGPFTPPGFYYKTFIRPRRLWPLYEKVLRNAAGLGKLRHEQEEREWRTEYRRRHADVLVVGGGIAGLRAASAAAELGADVVLVDEGPELGGQQLIEPDSAADRGAGRDGRAPPGSRSSSARRRWATSTGWCRSGSRTRCTRCARSATSSRPGTIEQPLVFAGNDLAGRDARRRRPAAGLDVRRQPRPAGGDRDHLGPRPARRRPRCASSASRSWRSPTCDPRPATPASELRREGVPVFSGYTVVEAKGRKAVTEAVIAPVRGGDEHAFACDLLVVSGGAIPATSLLLQAGARSAYDPARAHFGLAAAARRHLRGRRGGRRRGRRVGPGVRRAGRPAGGARARTRAATSPARESGHSAIESARPAPGRPTSRSRRRSRAPGGASASRACART